MSCLPTHRYLVDGRRVRCYQLCLLCCEELAVNARRTRGEYVMYLHQLRVQLCTSSYAVLGKRAAAAAKLLRSTQFMILPRISFFLPGINQSQTLLDLEQSATGWPTARRPVAHLAVGREIKKGGRPLRGPTDCTTRGTVKISCACCNSSPITRRGRRTTVVPAPLGSRFVPRIGRSIKGPHGQELAAAPPQSSAVCRPVSAD